MTKYCEVCGKLITGRGARFCSKSCYRKWCSSRTGMDAPNWKGGLIKCVCKECGKEFEVPKCDKERRKYCSQECCWISRSANMRGDKHPCWVERELRECAICGETFECLVTSIQRFCSYACRGKWNSNVHVGENAFGWKGGKIQIICKECGKRFDVYPFDAKRQFCSQACHYKYSSGSRSPLWRGGGIVYALEWDDVLRKQIRERDGHTCAVCRLPGKDVHHIDYDKQNCQESNLIVLCRSCHTTTNTNREYWEKGLSKLIVAREHFMVAGRDYGVHNTFRAQYTY